MQFIKHRVNRIQDLKQVHPTWGVEIDLRSDVKSNGALHLSHDPWAQGDSFEEWLQEFKKLGISGPIILNTKEDGLETQIEKLILELSIERYFFLDTALPTLVKKSRAGQSKLAVRLSAYEPYPAIQPFVGKVEWAWVDCFDVTPLDPSLVLPLKKDFKVCLVSPELQGGKLETDVKRFLELGKMVDAICTKNPEIWMDRLK